MATPMSNPTKSVGINALCLLKSQGATTSREVTVVKKAEDNQMSSALIISEIDQQKKHNKAKLIDFQNIDFLGPAEAMKELFSLPYCNNLSSFALHRMGNTLLIESLTNFDENKLLKANLASIRPELFPNHGDISSDNIVSTLSDISGAMTSHLLRPLTQELHTPNSNSEVTIQMESPYLPPPGFYFASSPRQYPFKQLLQYQLDDVKIAMGSDITVYSTSEHPALVIKPIDSSRDIEFSTCLDYYLDNVMSNVPELAVYMHSKGFLRGVQVVKTEDIPSLPSILKHGINSYYSAKEKVNIQTTESINDGIFDPKLIEYNALTILRFLKENCHKENCTYIVKRSPVNPVATSNSKDSNFVKVMEDEDSIQIYDLSNTSLIQQKKWKWMLAMVSHRFAVRLGHQIRSCTSHAAIQIRNRQLELYHNCLNLLGEIKELGGERHGTICSAVMEHIADIHLDRINEYTKHRRQFGNKNNDGTSDTNFRSESNNDNSTSNNDNNDIRTSSSCCTMTDDEYDQFDIVHELVSVIDMLESAVREISDIIEEEEQAQEEEDNGLDSTDYSFKVGDIRCSVPQESIKTELEKMLESGDAETDYSTLEFKVTLLLQYSGALHKLLNSACLVIKQYIHRNQFKSIIAMYERVIIAPCKKYLTLMNNLKTLLSKCYQVDINELLQDVWNMDQSVLAVTPNLCEVVCVICRYLYKQQQMSDKGSYRSTENMLIPEYHNMLYSLVSLVTYLICASSTSKSLDDELSLWVSEGTVVDTPSSSLWVQHVLDREHPFANELDKWKNMLWFYICGKNNQKIKNNNSDNSNGSTSQNILNSLYYVFMCVSAPVLWANTPHTDNSSDNSQILNIMEIQCYILLCRILQYGRLQSDWGKSQWSHSQSTTISSEDISPPVTKKRGSNKSANIDKSTKAATAVTTLPTNLHTNNNYVFMINVLSGTDLSDCVRKLADTCNELGQIQSKLGLSLSSFNAVTPIKSLATLYSSFESGILKKCNPAFMNYTVSIELFKSVNDSINISNILCNISNLYRLLSTQLLSQCQIYYDHTIATNNPISISSLLCNYFFDDGDSTSTSSTKKQSGKSISDKTGKTGKVNKENMANHGQFDQQMNTLSKLYQLPLHSALNYVEQALNACRQGHEVLNDRKDGRISSLWDRVSLEVAHNFFALGKLHRVCMCDKTLKSNPNIHDSTTAATDNRLYAHIVAANESFSQAIKIFQELRNERYVAATHFELGSLHYWGSCIGEKNADGRNFSSTHIEQAISHYKEAHSYFLKYDVGPSLLTILIDMSTIYLHCYNQKSSQDIQNISKLDLLTNLGMAYEVLMECRFVLTSKVTERYQNYIYDAIPEIVKQLCTFLKYILKLFPMLNISQLLEQYSDGIDSELLNENSLNQCQQLCRQSYTNLLTNWKSNIDHQKSSNHSSKTLLQNKISLSEEIKAGKVDNVSTQDSKYTFIAEEKNCVKLCEVIDLLNQSTTLSTLLSRSHSRTRSTSQCSP